MKAGYPINLPTYITSRPRPVDVVWPNPKTQEFKLALQLRRYLHTYTSFRIRKGKIKTRQPDYSRCSTFPLGMVFFFHPPSHPPIPFLSLSFARARRGGPQTNKPKHTNEIPINQLLFIRHLSIHLPTFYPPVHQIKQNRRFHHHFIAVSVLRNEIGSVCCSCSRSCSYEYPEKGCGDVERSGSGKVKYVR